MAFTTINITYNPHTAKVYTHNISPTETIIQITGDDTQISGIRLRPLLPNGQPVPGTQENSATL